MKTYYKHIILWGLLSLSLALPAGNYVIINQVMYDSPLNENVAYPPYSNGEFIELYNGSDASVSLHGWHLTGDSPTENYYFQNISIPSKGFLVIAYRHLNSPTFELSDCYELPIDNPLFQITYQSAIVLANQGETLTLYNGNDSIVDQIYYDGTSHLSKPDRLSAENADNTPGNQCVSLHRTWVEFDENGLAITEASQWLTDFVSFAYCQLPEVTFGEHYITGGQALPTSENYVLSVTPLDPAIRISFENGRLSMSNGIRAHATIQYIDGIGRPDETIAMGITPDKQDLVSVSDYYDRRHVSRQWLPVVMETDGQHIDVAAIREQAQSDYNDSRPFAEQLYENSAGCRPVAQKQAGTSYAYHPATQTYSLNSEDDAVRIFTVNSNGTLHADGTCYAAGTLYKNTTKDEDNKSAIEYRDKQGKIIMVKRGEGCTYYVYDELGRLRFTLPNLPSSKLTNGNYDLTNSTLKAIAYCYKYDNRGNMIYKRLPGCEPQYMVYDQIGQLVLKQDGNQRIAGKWTLCAYDSIGRNLYTAEISLPREHDYYLSLFADKWQVEHYGNNPAAYSIAGTGYASTILGKNNLQLLTLNYYDNYDYLSRLSTPVRQALRFAQEPGYDLQYENATGMLAGTRVYNLSENGFTAVAYYYDAKGRVVQSRSTRNAGGYAVTSNEYHFDGSIAQQLTTQGTDSDLVREHYRYTYDHAGRVKNVRYQLNNDEAITLSAILYDSLGHLVQNLLHNGQDTISYSFDMRNMLTQTRNKHFSERLFYADCLPQAAHACYNGNLSAAQSTYGNFELSFAYFYDALNRLTESKQLVLNLSTTNSERFAYDDAGNIISLKRYVLARVIDNLTYSYGDEGNQLLSVTDNGQDLDLYGVVEYHNSESKPDTTMRYDANGNLVYDLDRGISVIRYNILNLPDTIQFINGNQIVNHYDAVGRKYRSITYTVDATTFTPHYSIEHYTFDTDTVQPMVMEHAGNIDNRYTRYDTTRVIYNAIGYYSGGAYYHYIKDHLGNICAVINSTADTLVQSTAYYASGVPMGVGISRDAQPYLYNSKEFVEAHGFNTYDYGFRGYYTVIGRFTTPDPLAEQTPWLSPYSYAGNNFINAIDWMGLAFVEGGNSNSGFLQSFFPNSISLTILDDYGRVIEHIDNDDNSVMHDGKKIGTELDDEQYIIGRRVYFMSTIGIRMKIFNFSTGSYVLPHTPWEEKVARWLKAIHVDKIEDLLLEYEQPIIQELALLLPIVSQYNDVKILINGESIYGKQADELDKSLAIVSLITTGVEKLVPIKEAINGATHLNRGASAMSLIHGLQQDYESIYQENN